MKEKIVFIAQYVMERNPTETGKTTLFNATPMTGRVWSDLTAGYAHIFQSPTLTAVQFFHSAHANCIEK